MNFYNKRKNVRLIIEEKFIRKLEKHGIRNYPNECGGFLVGYYSDDLMTLKVTDYILPKKQKASPVIYERSTSGLKYVFQQLFLSKNFYYIGEWHTHPDGCSMYSQVDLNAMIQISNCPTVSIENPILLILNISKVGSREFSVYLYDDKELIRYE